MQLAVTSPGTEVTAYAYLENAEASVSGPNWVEMGQVTFTSSASISAVLPASSASTYLDHSEGCAAPTP